MISLPNILGSKNRDNLLQIGGKYFGKKLGYWKIGIMEDWNNGKMRQLDNSTIRQWEDWNMGIMEGWNNGKMRQFDNWKIGRLE